MVAEIARSHLQKHQSCVALVDALCALAKTEKWDLSISFLGILHIDGFYSVIDNVQRALP